MEIALLCYSYIYIHIYIYIRIHLYSTSRKSSVAMYTKIIIIKKKRTRNFSYFSISNHIFDKKLFALILLLLAFRSLIFLHLRKFSFLISSRFLFGSIMFQSHSGYSESSKATGSSPFLNTFKFNTVPALQDDSTLLVFGTASIASFLNL